MQWLSWKNTDCEYFFTNMHQQNEKKKKKKKYCINSEHEHIHSRDFATARKVRWWF